jgi:hypothetical protein
VYWKLMSAKKQMDLKHQQQRMDLPLAFGIPPAQVVEEEEDRKLASLQRQAEEEGEIQRARLAAEGEELRLEYLQADKLEREAKIVAARAASRLNKSRAEALEVENHMRSVQEDIVEAEAAGRRKDATARKKYLAEAIAGDDQAQEPAKEVQAAKEETAPVAAHLGARPADLRSTE